MEGAWHFPHMPQNAMAVDIELMLHYFLCKAILLKQDIDLALHFSLHSYSQYITPDELYSNTIFNSFYAIANFL